MQQVLRGVLGDGGSPLLGSGLDRQYLLVIGPRCKALARARTLNMQNLSFSSWIRHHDVAAVARGGRTGGSRRISGEFNGAIYGSAASCGRENGVGINWAGVWATRTGRFCRTEPGRAGTAGSIGAVEPTLCTYRLV